MNSVEDKNVLIVDTASTAELISKMLGESRNDIVEDGVVAVDHLMSTHPDVIVADVNVQGSGIRLAELVGMSPNLNHIPVILTSSNPTAETILKARNAGASSYLAKPFRPSELRSRIVAVSAEANLPQATEATDEIAEKVQLDIGLLARVFKLVNSSSFGFSKRVSSLNLAITLLGLEEIANLVMTVQVFERLGGESEKGRLDLEAFWKHSIGTAFAAKAIARKLQVELESAFLAGMLHDLGRVVLDRYFSDYYGAVLQHVRDKGGALIDAEESHLGLTHTHIGGQLATQWQFAPNYLSAILHHHNPAEANKYQRLVCLVHMADILCREFEFGSGGDDETPAIDDHVLERFSLRERGMDHLREAVKAELDNAESFLAALSS
jgi:putative nucleotidyltransferase with HDIG domain